MGAELSKTAVVLFAHLPGNQYKALQKICWATLDKTGKTSTRWPEGHPPRLYYAGWDVIALGMGRQIPDDRKARDNLRREVGKVCRALVAAGALEPRDHPTNSAEVAYYVSLTPTASGVQNTPRIDADPGCETHPGVGCETHPGSTQTGVQNAPQPGCKTHPVHIDEQDEPGIDDLGDDASGSFATQPPVAIGVVASDNDSRVEFQAARERLWGGDS